MSAPTDRYAVIGHPIAHSRSPAIHAAFARQTGEPVAYSALLAPLDGFEATVRAWAAGGAKGCNVTVPFKFEACALCARRSSRAALAQAVNTLRFDADGWYGDNTDGAGLMRDIEVNAGRPLKGQRVLLIGAGGAAAGVLGPLMQCEPAAVTVLNRTTARAVALVDGHRGVDGADRIELRAGGLQDAGPVPYDVVINASSSSLEGAAVPVPATVLKATGTLAVDLMYGAAAAPFMAWAGQHGAATRDGLGMLVEQAAEAFALWRGVRPQTQEVIAMLRAALEAR